MSLKTAIHPFIFLISLLFFATPLLAQQKQKQQEQQKSKPAALPRPRPAAEPARPPVNPEANRLVLKIESNMDCIVKVDEEERARVSAGEIKRLPLPRGEFRLKFISLDGMDEVYRDPYTVSDRDVNTERFFEVDLQGQRRNRLEREGRDKVESDFNTALRESKEQQAAGNFESAQAAVQRALAIKPDNYSATEQLKTLRAAWYRSAMEKGDALLQAGKYANAKTMFESVLSIAPAPSTVRERITEASNRPFYDVEMAKGDSLLRVEKFDMAKAAYRRATELTASPGAAQQKIRDTDRKAEEKRLAEEKRFRDQMHQQRMTEFSGYLGDIKNNMVILSGASFTQGCQPGKDEGCTESDLKPQTVEVADFYIGKYEVTNIEFVRFLDSIAPDIKFDSKNDGVLYKGEKIYSMYCGETKGGCPGFVDGIQFNPNEGPGGDFTVTPGMENKPVVMVTFQGAQAFCRWLTENTGIQYHLPTEAEWEYAARGGKQGGTGGSLDATAWYAGNSTGGFKAVGGKQADASGLYDLRGNVMEWCVMPGNKPIGKGGSYRATAAQCSPGRRYFFTPANATGFRLASVPKY